MAQLAAVATYVGLAATAASAYSQYQSGKAQEAQALYQAQQDKKDAIAGQAEAQAQAAQERRRAKVLRSRALAVAGKSGAGVSDPTVTNILADIETEGEVRARNALFEGDYLAQGLRSGARSKVNMGRAYRSAGTLNAAGTVGASFYDKYG